MESLLKEAINHAIVFSSTKNNVIELTAKSRRIIKMKFIGSRCHYCRPLDSFVNVVGRQAGCCTYLEHYIRMCV